VGGVIWYLGPLLRVLRSACASASDELKAGGPVVHEFIRDCPRPTFSSRFVRRPAVLLAHTAIPCKSGTVGRNAQRLILIAALWAAYYRSALSRATLFKSPR
jgi:hypothetical protein